MSFFIPGVVAAMKSSFFNAHRVDEMTKELIAAGKKPRYSVRCGSRALPSGSKFGCPLVKQGGPLACFREREMAPGVMLDPGDVTIAEMWMFTKPRTEPISYDSLFDDDDDDDEDDGDDEDDDDDDDNDDMYHKEWN
jgi:hypothetical protein